VAWTCATYEGRNKELPEEFISGSPEKDLEQGHQRKRWMDCVEEDLGRASVTKFMGKHMEGKE